MVQTAMTNQDPAPSRARFMDVVRAYRQHNEGPKETYIAEIEARHGTDVAQQARRELVRFARFGKDLKA